MKRRCDKCEWWDNKEMKPSSCRRLPPTGVNLGYDNTDEHYYQWPKTRKDHWCSGFEELSDGEERLTRAELKAKHGTPEEFRNACVRALGEISRDEMDAAVEKYQREWDEAGQFESYHISWREITDAVGKAMLRKIDANMAIGRNNNPPTEH